ncbi:hypothetical protein MNO14_15385 [Luteimonas sp. S4-F44]|uniref:hypothetical protein n=1 Tax=Luteimonas sp. S4-F44 TaxID=2925842 RepID=UPI001F53B93C|nr:hypothetical protein [Luteimonas sp. S4-F44]UNK42297.1 hypothetical protein MNO14_15385 [Luteimonas sp. S4-F44]
MSHFDSIADRVSSDRSRVTALLNNGPGGHGLDIGPRLANAFSDTMKLLTGQLAQQQFPGVNFVNGARPWDGGAPVADARPGSTTLPGGLPVPPPPPLPALHGGQPIHNAWNGGHLHSGHPFGPNVAPPNGIPAGSGNDLAPVAPRPEGSHMPPLPAPSIPAPPPSQTGVLPALSNLLGNALQAVHQLLSPGAVTTPTVVQPGLPGGGPLSTPQALPTPITSAANQVVRALSNAVPATPPPTASITTPNAATTNTPQMGVPSQATTAQAMPAQQATAPAQTLAQQAAIPQVPQTTTAQPGPPAPGTAASVQPGPASVPVQAPLAQPQRTDAAVVPVGNPAAERSAAPPQTAPPSQLAIANTPAGTTLAAVPAAVMAAQTPPAQQVAGNTQIAGNPQATTPAAGERGGPSRVDLVATGVYTADGPGLRRRNWLKVGPADIGQWMLALAQGRRVLIRPQDDLPAEIARAMQWLFWTLALVAYGCLGLVLVSVLLNVSDVPTVPAMRRWSSELAFAGLAAACGAWWLARRLNAPARGSAGPLRR